MVKNTNKIFLPRGIYSVLKRSKLWLKYEMFWKYPPPKKLSDLTLIMIHFFFLQLSLSENGGEPFGHYGLSTMMTNCRCCCCCCCCRCCWAEWNFLSHQKNEEPNNSLAISTFCLKNYLKSKLFNRYNTNGPNSSCTVIINCVCQF